MIEVSVGNHLALYTFGAVLVLLALMILPGWIIESRRQRKYRDALARRDWREVHRLMGFEVEQ